MTKKLLIEMVHFVLGPSLSLWLLVAQSQAQAPSAPRPEYPRPDLMRSDWQTLNGPWEFEFDDTNRGLTEHWYAGSKRFTRTIQVPYCFQSQASGIGDTSFHDVVWYRRTVQIPEGWRSRRVMLHFGAVDYEATVWVNGDQAGSHRGGHVGFSMDISSQLKPGANVITVRAWDPSIDKTLPRGKQYWKPQSEGIWYTQTTGIWQPVWIEPVDAVHVKQLRITPDVDHSEVSIEVLLSQGKPDLELRVDVRLGEKNQAASGVSCQKSRCTTILRLEGQQLWSPEKPALYDLGLQLLESGKELDKVSSYFGQRKVSVHDRKVYLNNRPYYLKLVLDQGYWPETLLTPPSEEAIQYDIKMTKAFGFNGARKHQKVEDPRWLYWADRMGLLVWGEMANAQDFSQEYVARFTEEWQQVLVRDYNHPCIITWVPINESWGVPQILTNPEQQAHARAMYHLIHSLDQTRLVVDNDGWEHTEATDLMTLHDYSRAGPDLAARYKGLESDPNRIPRSSREVLAFGSRYDGTPIVMSEFGGIAYRQGAPALKNEWGYSGIESSKEAMLDRLNGLVNALMGNSAFAGFCYTQLTDVEQEINGLLTYQRRPKAEPAEFAKIFNQP
jgi:beta-galactosidase/beta-glucuronidase